MLTWVYKSNRKANTYLYVSRKDDFSQVPAALVDLVGDLELVIEVDLAKRQRLALADIEEVKQNLLQRGFYLQLPPGDAKPERIC